MVKGGLARCDAEFHEIKKSSLRILFEVDLKQTVRYISNRVKMLIGYNPDEIRGKGIYNFVILSDLPKMEDAFQRVILKEMTAYVKLRVKSKDREIIPFEIELIPIIQNRNVVGILGTAYASQTRECAFDCHETRLP